MADESGVMVVWTLATVSLHIQLHHVLSACGGM